MHDKDIIFQQNESFWCSSFDFDWGGPRNPTGSHL